MDAAESNRANPETVSNATTLILRRARLCIQQLSGLNLLPALVGLSRNSIALIFDLKLLKQSRPGTVSLQTINNY